MSNYILLPLATVILQSSVSAVYHHCSLCVCHRYCLGLLCCLPFLDHLSGLSLHLIAAIAVVYHYWLFSAICCPPSAINGYCMPSQHGYSLSLSSLLSLLSAIATSSQPSAILPCDLLYPLCHCCSCNTVHACLLDNSMCN